jgi:hypothetical protein
LFNGLIVGLLGFFLCLTVKLFNGLIVGLLGFLFMKEHFFFCLDTKETKNQA